MYASKVVRYLFSKPKTKPQTFGENHNVHNILSKRKIVFIITKRVVFSISNKNPSFGSRIKLNKSNNYNNSKCLF